MTTGRNERRAETGNDYAAARSIAARLVDLAGPARELTLDQMNALVPLGTEPEIIDEIFRILVRRRIDVIDLRAAGRHGIRSAGRKSVAARRRAPGRNGDGHGLGSGAVDFPFRTATVSGGSMDEAAGTEGPPVSSANLESTSRRAGGGGNRQDSGGEYTMISRGRQAEELPGVSGSGLLDGLSAHEQSELLANPLRVYLGELAVRSAPAPDEEAALLSRASAGDEQARQKLVSAYLPLVVRLARRYKRSGVPFMELLLAGNEGLVEASRHYTNSGDRSFAKVARWWIGHALSRCVAENWRASRLPRKEAGRLKRMAGIIARYRAKRGREPSPVFLSRAMRIPLDEIFFLKGLFESPLSLYAPVGDGADGTVLADLLADTNAREGQVASERLSSREALRALLDRLDTVSRRVIVLRYGIDDDLARSREEVAGLTGLTRQDVETIEEKALARLRSFVPGRSGDILR